jgi:hypothetical protein
MLTTQVSTGLRVIFLVFGLGCELIAGFKVVNPEGRINFTAMGLAFWFAATLL